MSVSLIRSHGTLLMVMVTLIVMMMVVMVMRMVIMGMMMVMKMVMMYKQMVRVCGREGYVSVSLIRSRGTSLGLYYTYQ